MTLDKIIVTLLGIIGIIFTYWFFLMKKSKSVMVSDSADSDNSLEVDIVVDGGYSPDVISVPKGKKIKINFIRKDPSTCLEEVVLSDFSAEGGSAYGGKIRKYLPLNQKITIELYTDKVGEFNFSCGMNMYHGKIIVK